MAKQLSSCKTPVVTGRDPLDNISNDFKKPTTEDDKILNTLLYIYDSKLAGNNSEDLDDFLRSIATDVDVGATKTIDRLDVLEIKPHRYLHFMRCYV